MRHFAILVACLCWYGTSVYSVHAADRFHDWSGFYYGLNGGYGWNHSSVSLHSPHDDAAAAVQRDGFAPPVSADQNNAVFGGQLGYNWVNGRSLFGLEGDFDYSGIDDRGEGSDPFFIGIAPIPGTAFSKIREKENWVSTLRARFGYVASDRFLLFATAGLALAEVNQKVSLSYSDPNTPGFVLGSGFTQVGCRSGQVCASGEHTGVAAGFALGAGAEWAVSSNVSLKMEYLYVNLENDDLGVHFKDAAGTPTPSYNAKGDSALNFLRVGFNVKY